MAGWKFLFLVAVAAPLNADAVSSFAKPKLASGRFENPTSFNNWGGIPGAYSIAKWRLVETDYENVPKEEVLDTTIPVHNMTSFEPTKPSKLYASWLGHATVLVHMGGSNFITDPIWAKRASFVQFAGAKRYRPPPMEIEKLPKLDFALISHDHYDHLDKEAVKQITKANPAIRWFVPLGMQGWMKTIGIENNEAAPNRVTEMNWGDSQTFSVDGRSYTVWCLPAQHWGQRGPFDRNWRLWSGWAVVGPSKRFYYSGDTGFCDKEFRKIGENLGPFDLAAIPIGAYAPRWFMKSQHINPEEAVQLHEMVRSKMSLGIHWGTYHMGSYEYYLEPKEKLAEIMSNRTDLNPFITMEMGLIWEEREKTSEGQTPRSPQ